MKTHPVIFAGLSLLCCAAAHARPSLFADSPAYRECTQLAATNPIAAEQKAAAWLKIDQGIGAQHCRAMALYGQRHFADAADALSALRAAIPADEVALRSYVARQAASAWVDGGRPDGALAILSLQLDAFGESKADNATVAALTAQLLRDRAKLRMNYGQLDPAIQDLDRAVSLTPVDAELLFTRARLFEMLGDRALALKDLQAVLLLKPEHKQARALQAALQNPAPASATKTAQPAPGLKPLQ